MLIRNGWILALPAMLLAGKVQAAQFTLHDAVVTHDAQNYAQAYAAVPTAAPANWKAPDDYAGGTAYFRLEPLDKPTETGITYQACLEQDGRNSGKRACAKGRLLFDKDVVEWSQPMAEWTLGGVDFARRPQEQLLILQDCLGVPVNPGSTNWVGQPYLSLYYPMRVRFSVVLVSKGGTFGGWGPLAVKPGAEKTPALLAWNGPGRALEIRVLEAASPGAGPARMRVLDPRGRLLRQWRLPKEAP